MLANIVKFVVWLVMCVAVGFVGWRITSAGVTQAAVIPVGTFIGITLFFRLFNQAGDDEDRSRGDERSVLVTSQRLWPTPLNTLASLLLVLLGIGAMGLALKAGWVLAPIGAVQLLLGLASWGWVDVEVGEVRLVRAIRPHTFHSGEVQQVYVRSLDYIAPYYYPEVLHSNGKRVPLTPIRSYKRSRVQRKMELIAEALA